MTETTDTGQVTGSAAEVYEEFFVPALFQEWAERVVEAADLQAGCSVLDVACGTGVLARAAANRVGKSGSVVGLDLNAGMLAVAAGKAPGIEWKLGNAASLPFDTFHFDAVISQFGLMFFEDRQSAIEEMSRVLKPGGRLAVAVWDSIDNIHAYNEIVELLSSLFGDSVADRLRAPFVLGNKAQLRKLFEHDDLEKVDVTTVKGVARFPSLEGWIYTEVKGWVMADLLSDKQVEILVEAARERLAQFVTSQGTILFDMPAHIVTSTKTR